MKAIDAAYEVLCETGKPLHYVELTDRILGSGLWQTNGKTPEMTLNAQISTDINKNGEDSRFRRVSPGVYVAVKPIARSGRTKGAMSFVEAAAHLLQDGPLHYNELTRKAISHGLIETAGKTPEATMHARILIDIKNRASRGDAPRFRKSGKGIFELAARPVPPPSRKPLGDGLAGTHPLDEPTSHPATTRGPMSFAEAAAHLLQGGPLHYRVLTDKAIAQGLIKTNSKKPAATMLARILGDIQNCESRGDAPRFVKSSKGVFELASNNTAKAVSEQRARSPAQARGNAPTARTSTPTVTTPVRRKKPKGKK